MNVENLKKVLASIEKHGPEHFDMDSWFEDGSNIWFDIGDVRCVDINKCGTTACLAGHAGLVFLEENSQAPTDKDIFNWLGLEQFDDECESDHPLFHKDHWNQLGDIGKAAQKIAEDTEDNGDYDGAVYLLEELIEQGE